MPTAQIAGDDIIPFVKIPANNGAKSNQKTTVNALKTFILTGFNPGGGSISAGRLNFSDGNNNLSVFQLSIDDFIFSPSDAVYSPNEWFAEITNTSATEYKIISINYPFNATVSINPLIFGDFPTETQFAFVEYSVNLEINGDVFSSVKRTVDFHKGIGDDINLDKFVNENNDVLQAIVVAAPLETKVFGIRIQISRFVSRLNEVGMPINACAIRVTPNSNDSGFHYLLIN